ncbi:DUF58 domain-containing protein [Pontibacillus marinus]|uniref:DUF58 domain-containing protein n=1 Tax=Pontibacillus marinus TaxID=273164 RepID=UPI000415BFBF|nr:DUF58 domain-containing protein [Pontibacillus marinus]
MKNYLSLIGKLLFIGVLFGVLYAYAMFQGGFVSWFLFYAMLPFILYMICIIFYPLSRWKITRSMSKSILQSGDSVTAYLTIRRKIPFPLYYCIIEEYVPESLERKGSRSETYQYMSNPSALSNKQKVKSVAFPWFKRKFEFRYEFSQVPRGEHHFHTIRVRTGDLLGFVKKQAYFTVPSNILVYPHRRKVQISKRVNSFEEGAAPSFSPAKRDTTVVTGVREYMPGDKFSWIDWKTTAKKNAVMTKEFEQQKSSDILLVLDAEESDEEKRLAFEGCVELSASLIHAYKGMSSQLAFLSLGEEPRYFPFTKDQDQQVFMNQHLARIEPDGKVPFADAILRQQQSMPNNLIVMLVTRKITAHLKSSVIRLKQNNARVVLFLIDSHERITGSEEQMLRELTISGIVVNVLTESQMTQQQFEVNT